MVNAQSSPFEFRALCTPSNQTPADYSIENTHNVDNDWGLWGHNLWRIVGKKTPYSMCAVINGQRDESQYCFSAPILYNKVVEWIMDQWGPKGARFSILPQDNKKSCQCQACRAKGNTATNATPAVAEFVTKLAKRFPGHVFYMAAYHSTMEPPTKPLPKNTGVFLTTMTIPFRYIFNESGGYRKFDATMKAWKKMTPRIYVWEYDRNFDDYLSPYPCLSILQERFRYYRNAGIKGIFINGSGDDYSSFDDVQSYVLSKLMMNPDANVDALVRQFYEKYFPVAGKMIGDYYLSLERRVRDTNRVLPYYGTIEEEQEAYLNKQEFTDFWIALDKKSKSIEGPERQRVNQMLTAFAYTRLMLKPTPDDRAEMLLILKDYKSVPRLERYKETGGFLEELIKK